MDYQSHQILLKQIFTWIQRGEIVDPYNDFFIEVNETGKKYQNYYAQNMNHHYFIPNDYLYYSNLKYDEINDNIHLKPLKIPTSIVSLDQANAILLIGKAIRVMFAYYSETKQYGLNEANTNTWNNSFESNISNEISQIFEQAIGNNVSTSNNEYSYTDMPMLSSSFQLPLPQILEQSVNKVHAHVSKKMYEMLLQLNKNAQKKINLLHHLRNMNNAFLLGDGQLFTALCDECDANELWTKTSPNEKDLNPFEFQIKALSPVNRLLYKWDENDITYHSEYLTDENDNHQNSSARLDLAKRLSVLSLSKSFVFQDFSHPTLPTLAIGGSRARHDFENKLILLSSTDDYKSQSMNIGYVYTRLRQEITKASIVRISFHLDWHLNDTKIDKHNDTGSILCLVFAQKYPVQSILESLSCSCKATESNDIVGENMNGKGLIPGQNVNPNSIVIKVMEISSKCVQVTINNQGSTHLFRIKNPLCPLTLTVKIVNKRMEAFLVATNLEHKNFHLQRNYGIIVATTDFPQFFDDKTMSAHIGVGTKSSSSKLLQWLAHENETKEVENEAVKITNTLSILSDEHNSDLPSFHQTRLVMKKVHRRILSKLAWLDGGGTISENRHLALKLYYSLPWPYHLVVRHTSMVLYNHIFNRIFAVQRANYEIHRCWRRILEGKYRILPNSDRLWLGPMWALRAKMDFFLNNLLQFWKLDVGGSAFHELQMSIQNTNSFEYVEQAYARYLAALRRRFFFDSLPLCQSFQKILAVILRFTEVIRQVNVLGDIPHGEILRLTQFFETEVAHIFEILQQSDAVELCARLDFNGWFTSLCSRRNQQNAK